MRQNIEQLMESNFSSNQIASETGLNVSVISRIRNGERDIDNLTLKSAEKLSNMVEHIKHNVIDSYNQTDYPQFLYDNNLEYEMLDELFIDVEQNEKAYDLDILEFGIIYNDDHEYFVVNTYDISNFEVEEDLRSELDEYLPTIEDFGEYKVFNKKESAIRYIDLLGAKELETFIK